MTLNPTIGLRDHLYSQQGSDIPAVSFNQMMDQQTPSSSLVDVPGVEATNAKEVLPMTNAILIPRKSLISKSINGFQGQLLSYSASVQFLQCTKGLTLVDQHVCLFLQQ